jgi:hypothetical protein
VLYAHLARLDGGAGSGGSYARFASATTDGAGAYVMVFVMPATWPNGATIATQRLVILVAPDTFAVEASTTFSYQQVASAGDEIPSPTATVVPPTATSTAVPLPPTDAPTPEPPTATPSDTATPPDTATPEPTPTEAPGGGSMPPVEPPAVDS